MKERPESAPAGISYLQFAQAHAEPQLQLTHVQFGLLHFTF